MNRHMKKNAPSCHRAHWAGLLLALATASAYAQAETGATGSPPAETASVNKASTQQRPIADGHATQTWLAAQASGEQASKRRQTLSGPVMKRIHERYLQSFTQQIPERFESQQ